MTHDRRTIIVLKTEVMLQKRNILPVSSIEIFADFKIQVNFPSHCSEPLYIPYISNTHFQHCYKYYSQLLKFCQSIFPRAWHNKLSLGVEEVMGSMLGPNHVIAKEVKVVTTADMSDAIH